MRKTLLSLFLICLFLFTKAQQKFPSLDFKPQSPATAAFTRYGDVPVDLSTGVPSISIPIYTLTGNGIEVPISISYHASGIKVQDIASVVGLGWTLNAGGVITRTLLGEPDELMLDRLQDGHPFTQTPPWKTTQEFMADNKGTPDWYFNLYQNYMTKQHIDFHSDRFYCNLGNGDGGIFRRDFINGAYKFIPYKPFKVRFYWDNITKIEITTNDGVTYTFKHNIWDLWHPEKIVNSSKTDSIVFYSHMERYVSLSFNQVSVFGPYRNTPVNRTEPLIISGPDNDCWPKLYLNPRNIIGILDNPSSSTDEIVVIDSIVGTNASVQFTYSKDREDHIIGPGELLSRLIKVQVFSRTTGAVIKEANLTHSYSSYFSSPLTKRLMLDGVQTGKNGEEKYSFKYNPDNLPAYFIGTSTVSCQEDFWGYKNNGGGITYIYDDFAPNGIADRFPDEQKAQACILQEIKYPTGGITKFEYECNRVRGDFYGYGFTRRPADGKVGGLRVKRISNLAYEGATPQVKTYEYVSTLHPSYGYLQYSQFAYNQETFNYFMGPCGPQGTPPEGLFTSENLCTGSPMGRFIGNPMAPVVYDKVTEYYGDATNNSGKTVYNYELPESPYDESVIEPRFFSPWHVDVGNYTPRLVSKMEYKNENGQYRIIRKTETAYTGIQWTPFSTGFNIASDLIIKNLVGREEVAAWFYFQNYDFGARLHLSDNIAYPSLNLPDEVNVYDYVDANGSFIKTTTKYSYNEHGQVISESIGTSKKDELITKFTYPIDYVNQAPYSTMVARNILTPVIEQSTFKNNSGNFLQSQKTNYGYWNFGSQSWNTGITNQILPQTIETKKGANDVETRIEYFSYDQKSNPVYVAKENDARQLYIWSYNKAYPVAQVVNVPDDQKQFVSYTSFEDTDYGNWSISGPQVIIDDNTAPTGRKCFSLTRFVHINRSLNAGSSYILSYWYKTEGPIIFNANSTVLATTQPKNGWVYEKRRITGTSLLSLSGSVGFIDELRLYPETAQMTTFAYEPLVGITAQCDINDKITYYSYDASGRLSLVKDDNGNILKKICYNFQGQPDACGENALPLWQFTGVTRCKPCPQNSNYFTNIQQREERDNNANSDTYGNLRWVDGDVSGSCTLPPDWQNTGSTRCVTVNNQNTGEQQREQRDVNPCSGSAGQTRWVSAGTNTTACPLPPVFRSVAINKKYYKQNCGSQQIPIAYWVNLPEGAYTSPNSPSEAYMLADQEAQRRANEFGGCTTVYIKLVAVAAEGSDTYNDVTDFHFKFYSDAAGTNPLVLPSTFYINYRDHAYRTDWGDQYSEEGTNDHILLAFEGTNESVERYVTTRDCPGNPWDNFCRYVDWSILPGPYVIIP